MKSRLLTELVVGLMISLFSFAAFASETPEGNKTIHIVGVESNCTTAVYIRCKADYIAFPVIIGNDTHLNDSDKKIYFFRQIANALMAVDNPEQYRVLLISKIVESFEKLSETLQSSVLINISGLEKSVVVTVDDDEYLNLHIPYTLGIEITRGKK